MRLVRQAARKMYLSMEEIQQRPLLAVPLLASTVLTTCAMLVSPWLWIPTALLAGVYVFFPAKK